MCGISVEFSPDGLILDHSKNIIEKQLKCMENRGPDASAIQIINPNIVMGHNRLAIIGLEKESNQPMSYDNKFHIVFNGEIYNYKDIRDELVRQGESFKTSSDTEVILIGYKLYGQKIFEKLRGMFSIIIYDGVLQKLFVTRDSFGIKPLYFYKSKNGKYSFSSSVKALKYSLSEEFHLNHQSKILFDWFGFIPEPDTVYSDLFAIEPGVNYEFSIEGIKKIDRNDKLENIFINNLLIESIFLKNKKKNKKNKKNKK